jgi:hypothetical protein
MIAPLVRYDERRDLRGMCVCSDVTEYRHKLRNKVFGILVGDDRRSVLDKDLLALISWPLVLRYMVPPEESRSAIVGTRPETLPTHASCP